MTIELVAFDVAGTTFNDDGLVITSFQNAFKRSEAELWSQKANQLTQYALDTMGQSKIEVFTALLGDRDRALKAAEQFEAAYFDLISIEGIEPITGAVEALHEVKAKGAKIALTTGFSRKTLDLIITKANWGTLVDFTVTPTEAGAGRPSPLMLEKCLDALQISGPQAVVVVGDTMADMQAGVNFGAHAVVGVLTGTHTENQLRSAGATSVIHSVADIPSLI
jgi:phosphoglycolate phosphatase